MTTHTVGAGQHDQYGVFSGWDTFHSLSQLQAILDPAAASDQAQSLVNYYTQDKLLQQWGYLHLNNYVMVGDPAQSIIADYYAFGARDFDTAQALKDMLAQATTVNDVRPGEALEAKYGYLPEDGRYGCCNPHGFVPTLLEYDSQDLALSRFAAALGDTKNAAMLEARANNWQNVFDLSNNLLERAQLGRLLRPRGHAGRARRATSRERPTSTCGTCRTTTRRCSPCSAARRRSCRRCGSSCRSPTRPGCTRC